LERHGALRVKSMLNGIDEEDDVAMALVIADT
jgi:hypothetical protein